MRTVAVGIIPAHAGFTLGAGVVRYQGGDHPRTRGVYDAEHVWELVNAGSSPHTRGLP